MIRNFGNVTGLTAQPLGLDTGVGINTDDATATAGDLLSGKIAYAKGQKIVGTMPNKAGSNIQSAYTNVPIPAGYYDGTGYVLPPLIQAGDTIVYSSNPNNPAYISNTIYTKAKAAVINVTGTFRVIFYLSSNNTANTAYGRVYKNGSPIGIEFSQSGTTYRICYQDFYFNAGDSVEIWARSVSSSYGALITLFQISNNSPKYVTETLP